MVVCSEFVRHWVGASSRRYRSCIRSCIGLGAGYVEPKISCLLSSKDRFTRRPVQVPAHNLTFEPLVGNADPIGELLRARGIWCSAWYS